MSRNHSLPVTVLVIVVLYPAILGRAAEEEDSRSRWLNTTYDHTISHAEGKRWVQIDNKTGKIGRHLEETGRNVQYIEFLDAERKQTLRVSARRLEVKEGSEWKRVAQGHWDASSSSAMTAKRSETVHSPTLPVEIVAEFEVEPPSNLEPLMQASERERAYHIAQCKRTIREVLDQANASLVDVSSTAKVWDGDTSVLAAAKASGVKLDLKQLGTLKDADENLRSFKDAVFVRPKLRAFVPNQIGTIDGAIVVRIYDDTGDRSPDGWKRLLVEMPDKTRIMIKSFRAELVADGKPLPNPDTIYTTTGYTQYDDNGHTKTALAAEILPVPELEQYLEELRQVRQALKKTSFRRWTGKDGNQNLIGEFVDFSGGMVNIRKPDGTIIRVSMNDLASHDQEYIRDSLRNRRESPARK